jgi:hypothetical protein
VKAGVHLSARRALCPNLFWPPMDITHMPRADAVNGRADKVTHERGVKIESVHAPQRQSY